MSTPVHVTRGDGPVILGQPHGGTWLPDRMAARLNENGRRLADTDWHIGRLYDGLLPEATTIAALFHRYVIDANRDPEGRSLYPGQNTTALCPTTDFDGMVLWQAGEEPSPSEIADRLGAFHVPYHRALQDEIDRVRSRHGVAILWDCHSIRSTIPFLFDGVLPQFNIGTDGGVTCDTLVEATTRSACLAASGFDTVVNGRFKGGWTTRHYGRPDQGIHTIQMETAQRGYLSAESAPWRYDPDRADGLRRILGQALTALDRLARSGALS